MCDLETSRMRRPWPALGRSVSPPPPKFILNIDDNKSQGFDATRNRCFNIDNKQSAIVFIPFNWIVTKFRYFFKTFVVIS